MSASTLLQSLFQYKSWSNEKLFAELGKLDPQTQQAESHAALRILNHIYVVDRIFAAHLAGEPHAYTATNTPETPTLAELQAAVRTSDAWYLDYVRGVSAEALAENLEFTFTDGAAGRMSREEILAHVITHGGYHRGAVGRIMAQLQAPPPRDTFTVYLHQAQPERRERA